MFVNLDQTEGEKFYFFGSKIDPNTAEIIYGEPDENGPWMILRNPQPFWEKKAKTRKKRYEHVFNPKTRAMDRVPYDVELSPEDQEKESAEFWDWAIVDFAKFKDTKTKKVIECTIENKVAFSKMPILQRFMQRCFAIMDESSVGQKKVESKNS